jgi:hypothetical protein
MDGAQNEGRRCEDRQNYEPRPLQKRRLRCAPKMTQPRLHV